MSALAIIQMAVIAAIWLAAEGALIWFASRMFHTRDRRRHRRSCTTIGV